MFFFFILKRYFWHRCYSIVDKAVVISASIIFGCLQENLPFKDNVSGRNNDVMYFIQLFLQKKKCIWRLALWHTAYNTCISCNSSRRWFKSQLLLFQSNLLQMSFRRQQTMITWVFGPLAPCQIFTWSSCFMTLVCPGLVILVIWEVNQFSPFSVSFMLYLSSK